MATTSTPTCFICGDPVAPDDLVEYDGQGAESFPESTFLYWDGEAPILAVHEGCGDEDNAARAEAAHFASTGR